MNLTIAIPTFDRNDNLRKAVSALAPQLDAECTVLVVDNHSPVPASESISDVLEATPARVQFVRNRANVGLAGNVLRCIELCETEWLWFVCDDDLVRPDALQTVRRLIAENPDAAAINASSPFSVRPSAATVRSPEQYAEAVDGTGNFAFLSVTMLNAAVMRQYLRFGYAYSHGAIPHVAMTLMALRDGRSCVLSEAQVVEAVSPPTWPMLYAALGFPTILDIPMSGRARERLGRLLPIPLHRFENLVTQLVLDASRGDVKASLYYYDQVCCRLHYYTRGWGFALKRRAYRQLVRFPRLGRWVIERLLARKKGGDAAAEDVRRRESADHFRRI